MRNAQSYVARGQQSMVSAALRQAFIQPDRASASQTLRHVADQLRPKWPKLAAFIDDSEVDVLAHSKRKPAPTVDGMSYCAARAWTASLQFQGRSSLSVEARWPRANWSMA